MISTGQHNPVASLRQHLARAMRSKSRLVQSGPSPARLVDHGEGRRDEVREIEVIEAGKGQIAGHLHTQVGQRRQDVMRGQRIGREDGP